MVRVNLPIKMEDILKANSIMTKNMGKVTIDLQMVSNILEGGTKDNNMERAILSINRVTKQDGFGQMDTVPNSSNDILLIHDSNNLEPNSNKLVKKSFFKLQKFYHQN